MSVKDRNEVLKVLKNTSKKAERSETSLSSQGDGKAHSVSYNQSTSFVNKDWENWVLLHGKVIGVNIRVIR